MNTKRREALARGEVIYEGKPCPTCGSVQRYVLNDACVACTRRRSREQWARIKAAKAAQKEAA
jgi:hypothetical protein